MTRKRTLILAVLVIGSSLVLSGFNSAELKKDFASFDRAFIPPLSLTNQGKVQPSKKAMKILVENWKAFKGRHYEANPADGQWKKDFDMIDRQIAKAAKIVAGEKDLMAAHEALEEIRLITLKLRRRNKIEYFIDPLTEFHTLMETIYHTGAENTPDDLSDSDIGLLSDTLSDAAALWDKISKMNFDAGLFGFNEQKVAMMKKYIRAEKGALTKLEEAIIIRNKARILAAAKKVKPNYAKLYVMFGDFEALKK